MLEKEQQELKNEIQHIFDSGANEIRIFEMVKMFIDSRNVVNSLPIAPVIRFTPTKRDYFTAMAMQGLLAGRTEYEDPQSGLQTAIESADFIIDKLK